jgi:Zn-dependent peptidase ImmA (M78 family)/transcriptional regulator with XRE-family HTH domain
MQPNGAMLRLARQRRGFHQKDAAPMLGIEQPLLSRIENGLAQPANEVIQRAARAYSVPEDFFFLTDTIYGPPVSVHAMWRRKADVTARDMDSIVAELNVRAMHIRRFLDGVDIATKADIPKLDVEDYGDIEKIAGTVRAHWKIPSGPIKNLIVYAERAGIIVMFSTISGTAVSGVTFAVPGLPPIVLLNEEQPTDRIRYTLAHEIGHLVMHRFPSADMEREANTFASALLMPAKDIKSAFLGRQITLSLLGALKPEWRVSMQALLMRASSLGLLSLGQQQYLWKQISARGFRLREPPQFDIAEEAPTIIFRMLEVHKTALGYTAADLLKMLKIDPADMRLMYGVGAEPSREKPRITLIT